MTIDKTVLSIF